MNNILLILVGYCVGALIILISSKFKKNKSKVKH